MPSFTTTQESFGAGVLSPGLRFKPRSSLYSTGLADCINAVINREGSIIRRPSSRFVAQSNGASKLLRFTAVSGVEWVIELRTDKTVRFYTQQAYLTAPNADTPLSLSGLPYAAAELPVVKSVSLGNQIYLMHPNHTPRLLTYNASANPATTAPWTLTTPSFTGLMSGLKPAVGVTYGQRLVFSGFDDTPGRILFSRTPDANGNLRLTDFTKGTDADHALDFTTASGEAIYWLLERDSGVLFGTHSGMYILSSMSTDASLSATNAEVKRQSPLPIGVIAPQAVDQSFFVTPNSLRDVLLAEYSFELAGIQTSSQTVQASHLFSNTIQDMQFSQSEGLLWLLAGDELLSLSFWRETEVRAFTRHRLGGDGVVKSMAIVNGARGDQLWMCVARGDEYTIEFMQFNEVLALPHHLDSAIYKNDTGTEVSGLEHLNNKTVQVFSQYGETSVTIADNMIAVDRETAQMAVGFGYETRVDLLPPAPTHQSVRTSANKPKLSSIEIAVTNTSDFDVYSIANGKEGKVEGYSAVHKGGVGATDFTSDAIFHTNLPGDYDRNSYVSIRTTSAAGLNLHQVITVGSID